MDRMRGGATTPRHRLRERLRRDCAMARERAAWAVGEHDRNVRELAAGRHCQERPRAHGFSGTEAFASSVACAALMGL